MDANGWTQEIFAIIKHWEELEFAGYFPERVRKRLRAAGREFTLEPDPNGTWWVRPITYGPAHYVAGLDRGPDVWTFDNAQPDRAAPALRSSENEISFPATGRMAGAKRGRWGPSSEGTRCVEPAP